MPTPLSFNNGIYLSSTVFPEGSVGHLDAEHVMHMNMGKDNVTHLGMIEPYMRSGFMKRKPMFIDSFKPESVIEVSPDQQGMWTFSVPIPSPETVLIENISGMDKPGIDGIPFKLRFNRKFTGKTSIIKFSISSDVEFHVIDWERVGEYVDYTLQIQAVNSKDKYAVAEWLKPGQRIYLSSSAVSEYSTEYNDLNNDGIGGGGFRKFYNYVGSAAAGVHSTITREAAYSGIDPQPLMSLKAYSEYISMYEFAPGTIGHFNQNYQQQKVSSPGALYRQKYNPTGNKPNGDAIANQAMKRDIVRHAVIPKVEYLMKMQLMTDVSQQAVWGVGGAIKTDGGVTAHLPVGVWFQMQKGNYYTYNIQAFSLPLLEGYLTNVFKYKADPYQDNKPTVTIKTGIGGLEAAKAAILERYKTQPLMVRESDYVSGNKPHNMILSSPDFIGYDDFPYAKIRFEHETSFDPIGRDDIENPKVGTRFGSYHLSSFVFMIIDLSGEGDNIVEVRKKDYWEFSHIVEQGKLRYPISGGSADVNGGMPFLSNDVRGNPGFRVFMEKPHIAYWMKDPSKSLVIRPYNPVTGRALFASYFD